MGRARKRQVQQSFRLFSKPLDKNGQLRGERKGVKRGKRVARPSEPHKTRPRLRASEPVHVVLRAHESVGSLRNRDLFHAIREALITVYRLEDSFRIIHFSVQRSHVHLLVEASNRLALAKGMQVFGISAAMHINTCLRDENGRRRRGPVFPDRYYARILRQPRDVRNTLAYILRASTRIAYATRNSSVGFDTSVPRTRLLRTATTVCGRLPLHCSNHASVSSAQLSSARAGLRCKRAFAPR